MVKFKDKPTTYHYQDLTEYDASPDIGDKIKGGPTHKDDKQVALTDWLRFKKETSKLTTQNNTLMINNVDINEHEAFQNLNYLDFKNSKEKYNEAFENIIKKELIDDAIQDPDAIKTMVDSVYRHLHQGGLFSASTAHIRNDSENSKFRLSDPRFSVYLNKTKEGIQVKVDSEFYEWIDKEILKTQKPIFATHTKSGSQYYAATEAVYLIKPNGHIIQQDLKVNCPSKNLAGIFKKPEEINTRFKAMMVQLKFAEMSPKSQQFHANEIYNPEDNPEYKTSDIKSQASSADDTELDDSDLDPTDYENSLGSSN